MKRWLVWSACAVVSGLVACSSGTVITGTPDGGDSDAAATDDGGRRVLPIAAKDYDQTCTKDDDCALVTEGDACVLCSCQNAAGQRQPSPRSPPSAPSS